MLKAIITGISGLHNRGVEALLAPSINQLNRRGLAVTVLTKTPEYDKPWLAQYDVNLVDDHLLHPVDYSGRLRRMLAKYYPFYKPPVSPGYRATANLIRQASVVIASGGDIFSSDYGIRSLNWHLKPLKLALDAGVPVVFLAQSIGPFKTAEEAEAWLNVAHHSNLITVREKLSYDYLINQLGLSADLVKLTADPAFLLDPASEMMVQGFLNFYGLTGERPLVAIAASQGISRYADCDPDRHLESWRQVVEMLLNELDAQILLIPHVQKESTADDDRALATELLRKLGFDPRVRLAGAIHSASEFKGLIAASDLAIVERMHAGIAGVSSGVCTIVVGYSVKAEGILTGLLGPESAHNGLLISVDEFLDAGAACATIRTAWNRREAVAAQLKQALPRAKRDAMTNYDMIMQKLN